MDMNYGYPHEKLGEAIRALMLPATQGGHGRIIAGAIHEFTPAFKNREVDRIIQQYVDQINAIMEGLGRGRIGLTRPADLMQPQGSGETGDSGSDDDCTHGWLAFQ